MLNLRLNQYFRLLNGDLGISAVGTICSPGLTHMMGPSSLWDLQSSFRVDRLPHGKVICINKSNMSQEVKTTSESMNGKNNWMKCFLFSADRFPIETGHWDGTYHSHYSWLETCSCLGMHISYWLILETFYWYWRVNCSSSLFLRLDYLCHHPILI